MALTDFLTSGQQAITTPNSGLTQRTLPDWYTNYAMELLSNQGAVSNTPYATYQGPRIAEMTPLQQQGIEQAQQAAGAYRPLLDAASGAAQSSVGGSAYGQTKPYLGMAAQSAPSVVGQYMNPYTENVVNRIGEIGARTLNEQILPGIRDKFIAGGTYGGSRNAEMFGRGVRDAMEGISAQQAAALQQGYGQSMDAAQTDLGRYGTLGTIAGQTAGQDIEAQRLGAGTLASLASQTQQQGLTGAGALMTAGGVQQGQTQANLDLAYQDFLKQQGYPQAQIDQSVGTLKGVAPAIPYATSEEGTTTNTYMTPSALQTALGAAGLTAGTIDTVLSLIKKYKG